MVALDLAIFNDRQHRRVHWRIHVDPDDVLDLLGEGNQLLPIGLPKDNEDSLNHPPIWQNTTGVCIVRPRQCKVARQTGNCRDSPVAMDWTDRRAETACGPGTSADVE